MPKKFHHSHKSTWLPGPLIWEIKRPAAPSLSSIANLITIKFRFSQAVIEWRIPCRSASWRANPPRSSPERLAPPAGWILSCICTLGKLTKDDAGGKKKNLNGRFLINFSKSISYIAADKISYFFFYITQIIAKCSIINIWQHHIYCFLYIIISKPPFVAK